MSRDEWARLAATFPPEALTWCVARLDRQSGSALLEPLVTEAAVRGRLDDALGVDGWSKRLMPLGSDAVVCELELLGVHKSAAATSFGGAIDMATVSDWAFARAAGLFGMRPPASDGGWVDFDAEAGEPLFLPDAGEDDRQAAEDAPEPSPAGTLRTPAPGDGIPVDAAAFEEARSEGQQVIERLVERLKREGLGRQAATLVVEYGGYGRTPEQARELYRRLRELLLERGAPT